MYQSQQTVLCENQSLKYTLLRDNDPLSYGDFLSLLQIDEEFRSFFVSLLKDVPYRAFHWETPPVSSASTNQPFEFVVTNSPGIDLAPSAGPFRQYFEELTDDNGVAVFKNLGKDATLVAPAPVAPSANYSHIGTFTDQAPESQQHELWQKVAAVTEERLTQQPLWLNTAGGGVAWLHLRLDSRPKYYKHHSYCSR